MIQATIPATCEECQHTFPPQDGGICGRCGRVLCGWHLHGFGGKLRHLFRTGADPGEVLCVRCARGEAREGF